MFEFPRLDGFPGPRPRPGHAATSQAQAAAGTRPSLASESRPGGIRARPAAGRQWFLMPAFDLSAAATRGPWRWRSPGPDPRRMQWLVVLREPSGSGGLAVTSQSRPRPLRLLYSTTARALDDKPEPGSRFPIVSLTPVRAPGHRDIHKVQVSLSWHTQAGNSVPD